MTPRSLRRLLPLAVVALGILAACNPEGSVDAAEATVTVDGSIINVAGWAYDRDDPARPIDVHIYVDDQGLGVRADGYRPDVEAARPGAGAYHGYNAQVNVSAGSHRVCLYAINLPGTAGDNVLLDCRTVVVAAQPTTTVPPTTSVPATLEPWQSELLGLINAERARVGVPAVTACTSLQGAAQSYAGILATNNWFDTVGPDGSDAVDRSGGYGGAINGENIALGLDTPADVMANALASSGQSANITAAEFSHVGMGRAGGDPDGDGPQNAKLYWVVDYGSGGTC